MISTRLALAIMLVVAMIGGLVYLAASKASACAAVTVVGIGGYNDPESNVYPPGSIDVRVRHSGVLGDFEGEVRAFGDAVNRVRSDCPGTHILATGFSQGAAAVHMWLQRNPGMPNKTAVLFADPKQVGTGVAFWMRDNNFGGTTTVSVCRARDVICNARASWFDYPREHLAYNFQPRIYAGQTGIRWE